MDEYQRQLSAAVKAVEALQRREALKAARAFRAKMAKDQTHQDQELAELWEKSHGRHLRKLYDDAAERLKGRYQTWKAVDDGSKWTAGASVILGLLSVGYAGIENSQAGWLVALGFGLLFLVSSLTVLAVQEIDPVERYTRKLERELTREFGDVWEWPSWVLTEKIDLLRPTARSMLSKQLSSQQTTWALVHAKENGHLPLRELVNRAQKTPLAPPKKRAPRAAPPVRASETLEQLQARHHELSVAYGEYLSDPVRVLEAPLLNDVRDPHTAEFVEAYAALTSFGGVDVVRYEALLERAWKAWRAASTNASLVGLGYFDSRERRDVERAQNLLALALDSGASESERASAYTQVIKLLKGLVVLPEKAQLSLRASTGELPGELA